MTINTDGSCLLMIEPSGLASEAPLSDELTRKFASLWQTDHRLGTAWRGWHTCACGARSDARDHYVCGLLTNSLALHYLQHHRAEVPENELEKLRRLA